MKKVKISIIAAISENRALGKDGKLLWQIPEDMKRFKKLTTGHVVIMGRKTFESLPEKFRPLPNRKNFIITRNKNYSNKKVTVCESIEQAISKAEEYNKEIFIIGGGQIYEQAIKYADKLYLTIVAPHRKELCWKQADTFFPEYKEFKKVVAKRDSGDDNYQYTFLELEK